MKEQLTEWLDDDDREYKVIDHKQLNWLINLKHGERVVLLGNPKEYPKRLEVVYKLNVSDEHKKIIAQLDGNQRAGFEKNLVMMLANDNTIYNISRNDDNLPESVVIKRNLYAEDLNRTLLFDSIQQVINLGMRATIHFQSLGGPSVQEKEVSSSKPGPSLYR